MASDDYGRIDGWRDQLTEWRRDFHRHPELAFEEERTSQVVTERLRSFGIEEVHHGIAKTGVVATIRAGKSDRAVALRADMDALPIHEQNQFGHCSTAPGKMHACGHDGHTAMLLGAARYLAETRNFDGRVQLIFQPAEEKDGGAGVMVREGLFERFPADKVFGLHNFPGVPTGAFATNSGPFMAAIDQFEIEIRGRGTHGAWPHSGIDPIVAASQVVLGLQTLVSRNVDPRRRAVVSVTMSHAGEAFNVIPETAYLAGGVRSFLREVQDTLELGLERVVHGVCAAHGASAKVDYERYYPATINAPRETEEMTAAALSMGWEVDTEMEPLMGSDDFAFLAEERPGSFMMIGNGDSEMLHTPRYDFNDELLTIGAKYWARLAESQLS